MALTLYKFEADWCGPCKQQKPIVDGLDEDYDDLSVETVDVDEDQETANEYGVRSLPTLVFEDGDEEVVDRFVGVTQRDDLEEVVQGAL